MAWDSSMMDGLGLSIEMECDVYDMPKFLRELKHKQSQIDNAVDGGLMDASRQIEAKLRSIISGYGVDLNAYINVINWYRGFEISVDGDLPLFVEYGTGIVGAWTPHPEDPWQYDVNNHGYDGWLYIGEDKRLHWTAGMPSRPFFYDLQRWIRSYGIVKRCINKRLRKIK